MKPGKTCKHFQYIVLTAVLIISIALPACYNSLDSEVSSKGLIPEKDFVAVLTDIYMTDGLLSLPQISEKFSRCDSVKNYIDVIKSHGYTYDEMNKTVKYYFIRKPKKLVQIYDQIVATFSEMESRYEKEVSAENSRKSDLWNGKPSYLFPSAHDTSTSFSIDLYAPNTYTITFTVIAWPDDITLNPRFMAWYCNSDSLETGKRHMLPEIKYLKDGLPHTYKINQLIPSVKPVVLKGSLLDYDNDAGPATIHISIFNISCLPGTPAL